jgi:apolipoprotein N-acyltransferase
VTAVRIDQAPAAAGRPAGRAASASAWPRRLLPVAAAVAGGLALLLAFPRYGLWWLAPVGVALLTLATHGRRLRAGFGLGAITGLVFFVPLLHWTNTQAGWLPWLLLSGLQAAYLALLGAALAASSPLVRRWPSVAAPVTAVLWVAQEALRDRTPFGGFPWARLAFSQDDSPLLRLAVWGGAPLVTFGVALAGGLLAVAVRALAPGGRRPAPVRVAVPVAAVGALAVLALAVPPARPAGRPVQVAIVQGNVPRLGLDFNAQRRQVLQNHVDGTVDLARRVAAGQLARPDLVIWPENASDVDPTTDPRAAALITEAARAVGVPILVGSLLEGPGAHLRNVGVVWLPDRGPVDTYVKRHPVPFAEYVPLRAVARAVTDKVDLIRADFLPGPRAGVLAVGPATVGDVICFEVAYDGLVRDTVTGGGQLLVVQTNNATFDPDEASQQLAMVRLRAVEHGRDALMASTVGISGFVTADGRVHQATQFNTPAAEVRELRVSGTRTLATRLGAGPEYGLVAAAVFALVAAAAHSRSKSVNTVATSANQDREGEV